MRKNTLGSKLKYVPFWPTDVCLSFNFLLGIVALKASPSSVINTKFWTLNDTCVICKGLLIDQTHRFSLGSESLQIYTWNENKTYNVQIWFTSQQFCHISKFCRCSILRLEMLFYIIIILNDHENPVYVNQHKIQMLLLSYWNNFPNLSCWIEKQNDQFISPFLSQRLQVCTMVQVTSTHRYLLNI